MASPERSFAERAGYVTRNIGVVLMAGAILAPQYLAAIFAPSLGLAVSGEVLRRVSDDK